MSLFFLKNLFVDKTLFIFFRFLDTFHPLLYHIAVLLGIYQT